MSQQGRWRGGAPQWIRHRGAQLAGIGLGVLVWLWLAVLSPAWLQPWQERITDGIWRLGSHDRDERRLIIIDIDERSLREVGPWPWPRALQAQIIQKLAEQGAALQVLDIVFADERAGDAVLLAAFQQYQPVLAQVFALPGQGDNTTAGQLAGALGWATCPVPFAQASGFLANHPDLLAAGIQAGHITPRFSDDGVVRMQPAILCYRDKAYSALALAALMQATGETSLTLQRGTAWFSAPWHIQGARGALPPIPLEQDGDLRIPWHHKPDNFISISAADLLSDRVPPDLLRGAWALVGSSAFGLNDTIATPYSSAAAGVQAHAQLMTAAMDGRIPYTPRAHLVLQALGALLGMGLLILLVRQPAAAQARSSRPIPVHWLPVAALGWLIILLLVHAALLLWQQWWVGWLPAALAVLAAAVAWSMIAHAQSRIDRDRLYTHLSSYLPAPVAAALALQPPSSAIKASTRHVCVLFADIRNFSAYCEARPPEEAAAVLHAFFSTATRIVQEEGGVIEAFQGDAVLAVWYGEPIAVDDARLGGADAANTGRAASGNAQCALQAAINLQAAMHGVLPDPAPAGLEPLALGIGVESGPAMAGSFGLASRRTHMVLGRTVTIASRLVGMTADLAHPILVGEGLAAQTGAAHLQSMGTFLLDGMRVPHHVYAYPLFVPSRSTH